MLCYFFQQMSFIWRSRLCIKACMRLRKVEEDMQAIIAQQQLILNKLSILESYMLHQFPQQQPQIQASTPQNSYRATSTSTPHHQLELVSPTPAASVSTADVSWPNYFTPAFSSYSDSHLSLPATCTSSYNYLTAECTAEEG